MKIWDQYQTKDLIKIRNHMKDWTAEEKTSNINAKSNKNWKKKIWGTLRDVNLICKWGSTWRLPHLDKWNLRTNQML
jgi:hypothetical protein